METCPKIAVALLALNFRGAPALYHPVGLVQGLSLHSSHSWHSSLSSHISTDAARSGANNRPILICLRPDPIPAEKLPFPKGTSLRSMIAEGF
jgi:hypothetical protein